MSNIYSIKNTFSKRCPIGIEQKITVYVPSTSTYMKGKVFSFAMQQYPFYHTMFLYANVEDDALSQIHQNTSKGSFSFDQMHQHSIVISKDLCIYRSNVFPPKPSKHMNGISFLPSECTRLSFQKVSICKR